MKKIFMILLMCMCFIFVGNVYAASVTLSGSSSGAPGKKITITIKGDFTGRVNLSASNGTLSKSNVWIENNSQTFTVTLGQSGKTVITATPAAGTSDKSGNIITVSAKSKTITIKEPSSSSDKDTTTTTKSSNCNLSKISLSVEGLSFKSSQTTYNIKVGADVDSITVKATPAHSKATYTVSGNKNLKAGNNVIKIVVKAENGATKTYKINVEKEGDIEETSSALTNLIIENMEFEEPFTKTETEYKAKPIKYTEKSLNVLAYTEAEQATYVVEGADNLKVGENTVKVIVTSLDESSTTEYTVTFEMLAKEEENAYVSVYNENKNNGNVNKPVDKKEGFLVNILNNNTLVIFVYVLALVEFGQVIYLYVKLNKTKKELEAEREKNKKD